MNKEQAAELATRIGGQVVGIVTDEGALFVYGQAGEIEWGVAVHSPVARRPAYVLLFTNTAHELCFTIANPAPNCTCSSQPGSIPWGRWVPRSWFGPSRVPKRSMAAQAWRDMLEGQRFAAAVHRVLDAQKEKA